MLRAAVVAETEPVVTVTQLLRLCRDEHRTLWEHHADPRCRERVAHVVAGVAASLPAAGSAVTISAPARRALADGLAAHGDIPPVVIAHALAELVDERYGYGFSGWFRRHSPYQPAVNDPIPLDTPDLPSITDLAPTAPPWRLANRLDETRRVRLAGAWAAEYRVVFDYSAFDALAGVVDRNTVLATCQPNRHLAEFTLPRDRHAPAFPVSPADPDAQREVIDRVIAKAVDAGATIAVLPELAITETLGRHLEHWVRSPGPLRLLVAGSFHHADRDDPTRRANRAIAWVRGHPAPLLHDKHSPADRPVAEDITPLGWPELRIYVTCDGWHLVIAVCRDLLNPQAVHALTEAGTNLVLAPSMSDTLVAFGGPVAQLVGTRQALVAVANNPAEWTYPDRPDDVRRPSRALFGHPGFTQQTRQVHAGDPAPGVASLRVRDGRVSWHSIDAESVRVPTAVAPPPAWLSRLAKTASGTHSASVVTLRPAAVLVLISDGPDGLAVLLTTRAEHLTHYPGHLAFPGGADDERDHGPVDTALREAAEETGLDATSVHVVGALPAFALPESGFMVTPVLAWTTNPRFAHGPNPAEVVSAQLVPLADTAARPGVPDYQIERPDQPALGVMTATILGIVRGACPEAEK